jgi:hypothetical protein
MLFVVTVSAGRHCCLVTVLCRCAPRIFPWGGGVTQAIYKLCLILKIML